MYTKKTAFLPDSPLNFKNCEFASNPTPALVVVNFTTSD